MLIGDIYGRLGSDPVARTTKAGADMATASVAVDVSGKDSEGETLWVNVLCFGHQAETLLRASRGETLAAMGRMTRQPYTAKDGALRESWTMLADSIIVAKSARPAGRPASRR